MFYQLLDFIVCTACKKSLVLLNPVEKPLQTTMRMGKAQRVGERGAFVGPLPTQAGSGELESVLRLKASPTVEDGREKIVGIHQGILVCLNCESWYPIRDGLPELLPSHLKDWDKDQAWLEDQYRGFIESGLEQVYTTLLTNTYSDRNNIVDKGSHYKKAEMSISQQDLPEGFFGPALVAPFYPSRPTFSLDLLARFVTTVSKLNCGINGVVCDLGVGYAWTSEWLVRLGYQVIGVDITRDYLLAGLPRLDRNIPHLIVADVENLPLLHQSIDSVLSFDAFHHFPDRKSAMAELERIMVPGATMVLVEPDEQHEFHPQSVAVMKQYGILERGFNKKDLENYIHGTALGSIENFRSDVHPHNIYTIKKHGTFQTDSLKPRELLAELHISPENGSVFASSSLQVEISITNCGDTVWLNQDVGGFGKVYLGTSLYDAANTLIVEDFASITLPRTLFPGQRTVIEFEFPQIPKPGQYIVEFDMVIHGFLRFKDYLYNPKLWKLEILTSEVKDSYPLPIYKISQLIIPIEKEYEENIRVSQKRLLENVFSIRHLYEKSKCKIKSQGVSSFLKAVVIYFLRRK
jgi:uncharacterized protein YbaR (Trm112 family)/SAM-dependent methyltransferase